MKTKNDLIKNILKMKKVIYLLSGIAFIFIAGCSKNSDSQLENEQSIILPDVDLVEIVNNFDAEIATFSSNDEFAAFIKKFSELTLEEKEDLIDNLDFETIEDILDKAYEGIDSLFTRAEFINYLEKYDNYLELVVLPNGEEEVIEKEITIHPILPFLNGEKLIKMGNTYQKYLSTICVVSEEKEDLKSIESKDEGDKKGLKYYVSIKSEEKKQRGDELELRWGDLNKKYVWEKEKDAFWCKNKRKAVLEISFPNYVLPLNWDGHGEDSYAVLVYRKAETIAKRKGIACIWYKYKTTITWNNFHFKYKILYNIYSTDWKLPNKVYANRKNVIHQDYIQYYVIGEDNFDIEWRYAKSNITTRGIWDKWLKVLKIW